MPMTTSRAETILEKLRTVLTAGCDARVERNSVLPEKIPADGLIVVYDGDPGEPEFVLGGFSNAYYEHRIEVALYIEEGDPILRDQKFDAMLMQIGQALAANPKLDALVAGLTYARPEIAVEPIIGAAAIKTGILVINAEYDVSSPLA